MAEGNTSRSYVSPLREQSALRTRQAVVVAAEQLFVEQGYVATTIEQIAQRAGVARPTVFAAAGNKRALLKLVRDRALAGDDEPVPVAQRSWYREALDAPGARRMVELHARNIVRVSERFAGIEAVLHAAAATDPELAELWQINEAERRRGAEIVVDAVMGRSRLRSGLRRDQAVDLLWAFAATDTFRRLVDESGWSVARYEQWLVALLCDQLLPPHDNSPSSP